MEAAQDHGSSGLPQDSIDGPGPAAVVTAVPEPTATLTAPAFSRYVFLFLTRKTPSLRRPLLEHLFGTHEFRRRYQRMISTEARRRFKTYETLSSLNLSEKSRIRVRVRHYENRLAAIHVWEDAITNFLMVAFWAPLSILTIFVAPLILGHRWIEIHHSAAGWALIWILYFCVFALVNIIPLGPLIAILLAKVGEHDYLNFFLAPALGWLLAVYIAYGAWVYRVASYPSPRSHQLASYLAVSACLGSLGVLLSPLATLVVVLPVWYLLSRRGKVLYPDAVLVDNLIRLLSSLERNRNPWAKLGSKIQLISMLEGTADGIEHHLYRRLRTRELATDLWLKARLQQVAAALRALKKWILTPMQETHLQLIARLSATLVHSAAGDWDQLERAEPETLSRPLLWRNRALNLVGAVLAGGIPLTVFWFAQRKLGLVFPEQIAGYLKVGLLIWAALALISVFDPLFAAKIVALKEALQLFKPAKKE